MNLQSALALLGLAVLAYVLIFSYIRTHRKFAKYVTYYQRLNRSFARFKLWINPQDRSRTIQREASLISASEFRLEPSPDSETEPHIVPNKRRSSNDGFFARYPIETDTDFQRLLKIDYWVRLPGEELVTCKEVMSLYRNYELDLEYPHRVHGLSYPGNIWLDLEEALITDRFYDLIVSSQIVDRRGPVSNSGLTKTNNLVFELSEKFDRKLQFDMTVEDALSEARLLDRFCKLYDLLVSVNVVAKEETEFSGEDIQSAAHRAQMEQGNMGMFHFVDAVSGVSRFTMANRFEPGSLDVVELRDFSTRGLILYMSLPLAHEPLTVFDEMISAAQYITSELSGELQDPSGSVIDEKQLENIRQQLINIGEVFHRVAITPGSEEALRLF